VIVADTDVLIDALEAGRELAYERVTGLLRAGELATTAINLFELMSGPRSSVDRLELLAAALGPVPVVPVSRGAAELAAAARRYLERRGEGIGPADYLVAGVCLAEGLPLLTRNREHFSRVPGLELVPPDERT
jgi:predicted nucleic acid-binding protein